MAKKSLSLDTKLKHVLRAYRDSFSMKTYSEENDDRDPIMDVFGSTPDRKRENRQYWGRELGMCWQLLVTNVLSHHCTEYSPAIKLGDDEPCDCCVGKDAIDTKYRIGSGDSGTLKKLSPVALRALFDRFSWRCAIRTNPSWECRGGSGRRGRRGRERPCRRRR